MDLSLLVCIGIVLLIAFLLAAFGYAVYSGLFAKIKVTTGKPLVKNLTIAYKFMRGSYANSSKVFKEACSLGLNLRCIGVYYDDPTEVPAEKLRYAVGCIVAEGDEQPDPKAVQTLRDHQFRLWSFPAAKSVFHTTFPFKGILSVIISVHRVYPALTKYCRVNKLDGSPWCEVLSSARQTIYFMAVLDKDDNGQYVKEFFVPEALAAASEFSVEKVSQ